MSLDLTRTQLEQVFESTRLVRVASEKVASYFPFLSPRPVEVDPNLEGTEIVGKPVRRVVTKSAVSTRGYFPSVCMGENIPWELGNELNALYILDRPVFTAFLCAQPLTAEYLCPWTEKYRRATPDIFAIHRKGKDITDPALYEVKDDKSLERDDVRKRSASTALR